MYIHTLTVYTHCCKVELQSIAYVCTCVCVFKLRACNVCVLFADYELQLQLLEAVFRLTDTKRRNVLSKSCFANQQLAKQFLKIDPRELDVVST